MSLKMCAIASGSKGNCTFISDGETNILIDLGISALRAEKALAALGASPDGVSIFITHSHSDHIDGLKVFCKRHPSVEVHCRRETAAAVRYLLGINPTVDDGDVRIGALNIRAVPVPHDVPCVGYIVSAAGKSAAVVTDIGEARPELISAISGCDIVMLESNHDVAMLRANRNYSPALKARILSAHGHLSNVDCAAALTAAAGGGVRSFILAHLSEENNTPSLAISEVTNCLRTSGITDARVVCASQDKMTGLFEVC